MLQSETLSLKETNKQQKKTVEIIFSDLEINLCKKNEANNSKMLSFGYSSVVLGCSI